MVIRLLHMARGLLREPGPVDAYGVLLGRQRRSDQRQR